MRGPHQPRVRQRDQQRLQRAFRIEIERGRHAAHHVVHDLQVLAAAELPFAFAEQDDRIARLLESPADDAIRVLDEEFS